MIDIETIRSFLDSQLTYTVELAKDTVPSLQDLTSLPIFYVGYAGIQSTIPENAYMTGLIDQHGEDLVEVIDIQIVCEVSTFSTVWKTYYPKFVGYNPNTQAAYRSSFAYLQGGPVGLSNGRFHWLDRWRINFPSVSPDI
jgi:hypothetical protein